MKYNFLNIKDFKIMYITTSIGAISLVIGKKFGLDKALNSNTDINQIIRSNFYIYSFILSEYGGTSHIKCDNVHHYFLKLNEILYNNFDEYYNSGIQPHPETIFGVHIMREGLTRIEIPGHGWYKFENLETGNDNDRHEH